MESLLSKILNRDIKGRYLGYFGSFSWAGAAVKSLGEFAEKSRFEIVRPTRRDETGNPGRHPPAMPRTGRSDGRPFGPGRTLTRRPQAGKQKAGAKPPPFACPLEDAFPPLSDGLRLFFKFAYRTTQHDQMFQQSLQTVEPQHVRPVGFGHSRLGMRLQEYPVRPPKRWRCGR